MLGKLWLSKEVGTDTDGGEPTSGKHRRPTTFAVSPLEFQGVPTWTTKLRVGTAGSVRSLLFLAGPKFSLVTFDFFLTFS